MEVVSIGKADTTAELAVVLVHITATRRAQVFVLIILVQLLKRVNQLKSGRGD